jgi:hypothetical protein
MSKPEGMSKKYTFSGSVYFQRMKELGTYITDSAEIAGRVEKCGMSGIFANKL